MQFAPPLTARAQCLLTALLVLTFAAMATACESDPAASECEAVYPAFEAGDSAVLHVAAECASDAADGSAQAPFATLGAALQGAANGTVILVAPGTYAEGLVIELDGIRVIGSSSADDVAAAGVRLQPVDTPGVQTSGADVVLRGLHIAAPTGVGVWVKGGSATVEACRIEDTAANGDGLFGFGVLVNNDASATIEHCAIARSDATGILAQDTSGALAVFATSIDESLLGGARISNVVGGADIVGCQLTDNHVFGIGVFSSQAVSIRGNQIAGTQSEDGNGSPADAIVVAELTDPDGTSYGPSSVSVGASDDHPDGGNEISGSARVGVLLHGDVGGTVSGNAIAGSGRAGIWLQSGAGAAQDITIADNTIEQNKFLGVSLTGGAKAHLHANTIADTLEGSVPDVSGVITMGDAIGLFAGSSARIEGNTLRQNARAGILGDALDVAATTIVSGNTYEDNAGGAIVIQHVDAPAGLPDNITADGEPQLLTDAEALPVLGETDGGMQL